jgi:signal transduction histidine kinase
MHFNVYRLSDPQIPADVQQVITSSPGEPPIIVQPLDEQSIAGYTAVQDIYGEPVLMLRADMPRYIYAQGQASMVSLIWTGVVIGIAVALVILLFLEKQVLSRLVRLSRSVASIGRSSDLSQRVAVTGKDELSSVENDVNGMLTTLEHSQRALRVSEERLRLLLENTKDVIVMQDLEGRYLYINGAPRVGIKAGDMVGKTLAEVFEPEVASEIMRQIKLVASNGRSMTFDNKII